MACNCQNGCKLTAAIELAGAVATKKVINNKFFGFWATAKNQKQALVIAAATDEFLKDVESDLEAARARFDDAFTEPFKAVELY
jgi:hypothetical protein